LGRGARGGVGFEDGDDFLRKFFAFDGADGRGGGGGEEAEAAEDVPFAGFEAEGDGQGNLGAVADGFVEFEDGVVVLADLIAGGPTGA